MTEKAKDPLTVFIVGRDTAMSNLFLNLGYNLELRDITKADIVAFIGGADISPNLYQQSTNPAAKVFVNFENDKRDIEAWRLTKPQQLKVGICRGGQFLNVMSGGKLYQHVSGHASPHVLYDALFNTEIPAATSSHHQQMIPSSSGEILAYSTKVGHIFLNERQAVGPPEVEAEVVYYQDTNCLCYQGHPEWVSTVSTEGAYFKKLLDTFTKEAA